MDGLELIKRLQGKRLAVLQKSLDEAKKAQLNAPSAMESHSDTTRSEMEKMVSALEADIYNLKRLLRSIPPQPIPLTEVIQLWQTLKIDNAGTVMDLILVPEGLGGSVFEGMRLISINTPLGSQLLGKKTGDTVRVSGGAITILKIN